MSSPNRAASAGPSDLVASMNVSANKRALSDSEEPISRARNVEREAKRPKRADAQVSTMPNRDLKEKEKRRRRKKKRKQSIVRGGNDIGNAEGMSNLMGTPPGPVVFGTMPFTTRNDSTTEKHASIPGPSAAAASLARSHSPQPSPGSSSVTLSTQSPPSPPRQIVSTSCSDKGKGRATTVPELHAELLTSSETPQLTELTAQLTAKTDLLSRHTTLLASLQQSLMCQICLDFMHKPYALAPCGHTACHTCLVSWFRAPPSDMAPGEALPVWLRKKTCPHCRAIITERPVEVWMVKDMVNSLVKSGLADLPLNAAAPTSSAADANADPWDGIFRKAMGAASGPAGPLPYLPDPQNRTLVHQLEGIHDLDDGVYRCMDCHHEIWDGVCSSCGRLYPGHQHAPHAHFGLDVIDDDDEAWLGHDDGYSDDDDGEDGDNPWVGMGALADLMFGLRPRLGDATMDDHPSADESGSESGISYAERQSRRRGRRRYSPVHEAAREHGEGRSDDEDGEYESSFIDDEEDYGYRPTLDYDRRLFSERPEWVPDHDRDNESDRVPPHADLRSDATGSHHRIEGEIPQSGDEDLHIEGGPLRAASTSGRRHRVIVSDDESGDGDRDDLPLRPGGRPPSRWPSTNRIESDGEEEEDGESNLANERAVLEQQFYGDDGSLPRRRSPEDVRAAYEEDLSDDGDMSDHYAGWEDDGYDSDLHMRYEDDIDPVALSWEEDNDED